MRVAVLKGGSSLERQVSLRSGARVEDALAALGHEVIGLDAGPDLVARLGEERPEAGFIAMHGRDGEDGTVQELLEILGIPYTGPGVASCIRCMDKVLTKHTIREHGIPTPDWVAFNATAFKSLGAGDALEQIERRLGFPLVVKPAGQGSALGVKFASERDAVPQALVSAFSYDDKVLLERYVRGRELAVSIVDGEALPAVEARPRKDDFFDFEARYEIGRTEFICPADLPADTAEEVRSTAVATYEALGCFGFARVDLILADEGPLVLEANAIPGMTETSLLPQAAEAAGMSFEQLIAQILDLAFKRRESSVTLPG